MCALMAIYLLIGKYLGIVNSGTEKKAHRREFIFSLHVLIKCQTRRFDIFTVHVMIIGRVTVVYVYQSFIGRGIFNSFKEWSHHQKMIIAWRCVLERQNLNRASDEVLCGFLYHINLCMMTSGFLCVFLRHINLCMTDTIQRTGYGNLKYHQEENQREQRYCCESVWY